MEQQITLTELVCIQLRKSDTAELRELDELEKRYLAEVLSPVEAELPPLAEWNRLLRLTLRAAPEREPRRAKEKLIGALQGERKR